jgi:hypothetical protein
VTIVLSFGTPARLDRSIFTVNGTYVHKWQRMIHYFDLCYRGVDYACHHFFMRGGGFWLAAAACRPSPLA